MLKLAVTVRDNALRISHDVTVQMEETRPVSSLITDLLAHLDWPVEYIDGRPLTYHLLIERNGRTLVGREPLSTSGILEGDILILAPAAEGAAAAPVPVISSAPRQARGPVHPPRPQGLPVYQAPRQGKSNETVMVDEGKTIFLSLPSASLRLLPVGENPGPAIAIAKEDLLIGRSEDCDVVLDDRAASRHHARIVYLEPDFWLEDLHSANGTMLDGRSVARERLKDGATIVIGASTLVFKLG